jgi:hypothetical protein
MGRDLIFKNKDIVEVREYCADKDFTNCAKAGYCDVARGQRCEALKPVDFYDCIELGEDACKKDKKCEFQPFICENIDYPKSDSPCSTRESAQQCLSDDKKCFWEYESDYRCVSKSAPKGSDLDIRRTGYCGQFNNEAVCNNESIIYPPETCMLVEGLKNDECRVTDEKLPADVCSDLLLKDCGRVSVRDSCEWRDVNKDMASCRANIRTGTSPLDKCSKKEKAECNFFQDHCGRLLCSWKPVGKCRPNK